MKLLKKSSYKADNKKINKTKKKKNQILISVFKMASESRRFYMRR